MKTVSMSGSLRANVGKKDAKAIRRAAGVPCVLYGGKEQLHFSVNEKSFKDVIFTPEACFINLNLDGKEYRAILQDVQYHPVTDNILHVDLLELSDTREITMMIPLKIFGTAPGILRGGKLLQKVRKLKIKAFPQNMPDVINIDISKLDINDSVKIMDLQRDNLTFLDPKNSIVVGVRVTRAVEEAKPADASAPAAGTPAAPAPEAKK